MSLLEAMAWGLPPICTPVGSIPEYVVDGANGILVDAGRCAAAGRGYREAGVTGGGARLHGPPGARHGGTVVRETVFESHVCGVSLAGQWQCTTPGRALSDASARQKTQAAAGRRRCRAPQSPCSTPTRSASWSVWSNAGLDERRDWTASAPERSAVAGESQWLWTSRSRRTRHRELAVADQVAGARRTCAFRQRLADCSRSRQALAAPPARRWRSCARCARSCWSRSASIA